MILFARHVGDENVNYMSRNQTFNPCYSAFVVDPGKYTFDITHLSNVSAIEEHTMLLNYNVGNKVCSDAQKDSATFACKGKSYCYDSVEGPKGYLCNCSQGYKGNPYLAYGCQDINECEDENLCKHGCKNTEGSYSCSCPYGNGRKDGIGCSKSFSVLQLSLGVGFGLLFVVIGSFVLCVTIKRRKLKILSTEWWLPINGTDYFKRDLYS